jgi:hypothetical protein
MLFADLVAGGKLHDAAVEGDLAAVKARRCDRLPFAHLARPRSRYVGWQGLLAAGASVNEKDGVSG